MADSLLQEVDQALRADRAAALWNKHKRTVVMAIVALLVAVAGDSAYQAYRKMNGSKMLDQMVAQQRLLETGKAEEAAKGFGEVAASSSGELKSLALVWQSRALMAAGQKDEAVKVLASATGAANLWSDVACLRLAALDAVAAKTCLSDATASPLAGERAQWAAAGSWSEGDAAGAKAALEKLIADDTTSQEARSRMMQWLAIIKSQEGKK